MGLYYESGFRRSIDMNFVQEFVVEREKLSCSCDFRLQFQALGFKAIPPKGPRYCYGEAFSTLSNESKFRILAFYDIATSDPSALGTNQCWECLRTGY